MASSKGDSELNSAASDDPRRGFLNRLYVGIDRQMSEMEAVLADEAKEGLAEKASAAGRERDARTLVALTRAFERLLDLERRGAGPRRRDAARQHDERRRLRREISERLERLERTKRHVRNDASNLVVGDDKSRI